MTVKRSPLTGSGTPTAAGALNRSWTTVAQNEMVRVVAPSSTRLLTAFGLATAIDLIGQCLQGSPIREGDGLYFLNGSQLGKRYVVARVLDVAEFSGVKALALVSTKATF